jgi:hypothetical protein
MCSNIISPNQSHESINCGHVKNVHGITYSYLFFVQPKRMGKEFIRHRLQVSATCQCAHHKVRVTRILNKFLYNQNSQKGNMPPTVRASQLQEDMPQTSGWVQLYFELDQHPIKAMDVNFQLKTYLSKRTVIH